MSTVNSNSDDESGNGSDQSFDTSSDKDEDQHPKKNYNADLDLERVIEQLEQTRAELQNANNEKEYLRYKLKESNMRIRNHKGSIRTFTQKLKTKKKTNYKIGETKCIPPGRKIKIKTRNCMVDRQAGKQKTFRVLNYQLMKALILRIMITQVSQ